MNKTLQLRVLVAAALAGVAACAQAAVVPVNLSTWSKQGPAANGNWTVAADKLSVTQSINGDPTFFVSADTYLNTALRGKIIVNESGGDDDYIGFVLGYTSPIGVGNVHNYVLLDWKQGNQSVDGYLAKNGFSLDRVQTTLSGTSASYLPGFWGHTDSAGFDVLATNYGVGTADKGWADRTEYTFEILYKADRVTVNITGGSFATPTTVLDVAGNFPEGRFGFYNLSQPSVKYSGLTLETLPAVPEPGSVVLALAGLALVVGPALRRRFSPDQT